MKFTTQIITIYYLIALITDFTILRFAVRISFICSRLISPFGPATRFNTKRNLSQISQSPNRLIINFSSSSNSASYSKNFIMKSSLYSLFALCVINRLFKRSHYSNLINFSAPKAKKILSMIIFCQPEKRSKFSMRYLRGIPFPSKGDLGTRYCRISLVMIEFGSSIESSHSTLNYRRSVTSSNYEYIEKRDLFKENSDRCKGGGFTTMSFLPIIPDLFVNRVQELARQPISFFLFTFMILLLKFLGNFAFYKLNYYKSKLHSLNVFCFSNLINLGALLFRKQLSGHGYPRKV